MLIALSIVCFALTLALFTFVSLFVKARMDLARSRSELARFSGIVDLEKHASGLRYQADAAKEEQTQLRAAARELTDNLDELRGHVAKQKQQVKQYNKALGNFQTAEQLHAHIAQQSRHVEELKRTIGRFDSIADLDRQIGGKQSQIATLEARARDVSDVLAGANTAAELQARIKYQENVLAELQTKSQEVEETLEMQEFGFYRPRYEFETSSMYQQALDRIRSQQKQMIKSESVVHWDKQWVVEGSDVKGRRMMKEQSKLMLRAFNGECDAAVGKVKYNNATTLEKRIKRSSEQINKLGKTNAASIRGEFLELKLQELYLVHEYRVKQQQEREEQQVIREQMREEEKARREVEEAEQKAAKEEAVAESALLRAKLELERATKSQIEATEQTKSHNIALAIQVAKLEMELKDAIDRKAKAIARAQLTKSGHVYVLSNIGSFGEEVFKIGMTRRLEPLERVKELGDASVPFPFDVHAMIYSENAPELENKLHRHFSERRVNLVNLRREYFHVSLADVIDAVAEYFGEITFVKVPQADEFRETLAQRKSNGLSAPRFRDQPSLPPRQLAAAKRA